MNAKGMPLPLHVVKEVNVAYPALRKIVGLAVLVLLAPGVFFYIRNSTEYSLADLFPALSLSLLLTVLLLLVCAPLSRLKNKTPFAFLLLTAAYVWFLQFYVVSLSGVIAIPGRQKVSMLIAILLVIAAGGLLAYLSRKPIVRKGVVAFIVLNAVSLASFALLGGPSAGPRTETQAAAESKQSALVDADYSSHKTANVYYVIMDGMASATSLQHLFKLDPRVQLDALRSRGFEIVSDAHSSYNMTHLSVASIFRQDYYVDENSPRYVDRNNHFPGILNHPETLSLFRALGAMDYKFYHVGNQWRPCIANALINCLQGKPGKQYLDWLDSYTVASFTEGSALSLVLMRVRGTSDRLNDGLSNLGEALTGTKELIQGGSKFFFVHQMSPHPPFTNEQCQLIKNNDYIEWEPAGYRSSAVCALQRMVKFSELIAQHDPDAIVVFQGDHGPMTLTKPSDDYTRAGLEERFSIFNAIKLPSECQHWVPQNAGNVETIKLVVGCLTGRQPALNPQHFAGFYQGPKQGTVERVEFDKSTVAR